MTVRQQWAVVGGVVLVLALVLTVAMHYLGDELFPVTVGSEAPEFSAMTLDADPREMSLDEHKGKLVLLNIWATWCTPCREEMPSIERLHQRYADNGLQVLAVSIDNPGMQQTIRDFVDELGLTFQILHDPGNRISTRYQVTGYPESFLIDRNGVIRKKVIGETDWSSPENQALVATLLGVPVGAPLQDSSDTGVTSPVGPTIGQLVE
jgi:cytochrome c biogenesis protein CcmG/thiol:disulfide interchange protein DsbE